MATRQVGSWSNGQVIAELDYDAGTNRLTGLRVINTGPDRVYAECVQISNGRKYSSVFLAGTTTVIPIPTAAGTRITQLWDAVRQRWDGVSISVVIPG